MEGKEEFKIATKDNLDYRILNPSCTETSEYYKYRWKKKIKVNRITITTILMRHEI